MNESEKENNLKGDDTMNAYAVKPETAFIAGKKLARTPASEENRKIAEFLDSHNFTFHVDKDTLELECLVTGKEG